MSKPLKILAGALVGIPLLYIASCSVISQVHDHDFDRVKERDQKAQVIAIIGDPSDTEIAGGRRVPQYGAQECRAPCAERLWYLNRLSLVGEAWAIELDGRGKVVRTIFVESP
jgi:hypothetical protein